MFVSKLLNQQQVFQGFDVVTILLCSLCLAQRHPQMSSPVLCGNLDFPHFSLVSIDGLFCLFVALCGVGEEECAGAEGNGIQGMGTLLRGTYSKVLV